MSDAPRQPYTEREDSQKALRRYERSQLLASIDAMRFVMQDARGRRFVADLLERLEGTTALWTASSAELGRRAALHDEATRLRGLLEEHAPEAYAALFVEDQGARQMLHHLRTSVGASPTKENSHDD